MQDAADAIHRNRRTVAAAAGAVAALLLWLAADWGLLWGLLAGTVVAGLVLLVLTLIGRSDKVSLPDMAVPAWQTTAVPPGGRAGDGAPLETAAPAGAGMAVGARVAAEGAGTVPSASSAPPMLAPEVVARDGPLSPAAGGVPDGAGDPSEDALTAGAVDPVRPGRRPPTLDAPRDGAGDDLRALRGVGPKLEALCHRLGIWHYDQIAAWSDEEVEWVDQHLEGFRGRVRRDGWVAQARALVPDRGGSALH